MYTERQQSSNPDPYIRVLITATYVVVAGVWAVWAYAHYLLMMLAWKHLMHLELWLGYSLSTPSLYLLASICISGYPAAVTIIIPMMIYKTLDRWLTSSPP